MRYPSLCLLVTVNLLALLGCAPKLSPVITVLEPVERELSGAQAQTHHIELPADKYFRIEVEQLGIDAVVEVRDAGGQSIATVNTPTARVGSESVLLETTNAGTYQVQVQSNEHAKKEGRYRLTIKELSNETGDDKRRLRAEEAMTEAARLNFKIAGSSDSTAIEKLRLDAIEQYTLAKSTWDRLGNTTQTAWGLYYIAYQYYELFEWKMAAAFANEAAINFSELDERLMLANSLQLQGMSLIETHEQVDFDTALNRFSEALELQRENGKFFDQANTTNYIGMAYFQQGELTKAREKFVEAGEMFNTLGEPQQAIWTLNNVASIDRRTGNYANAVDTFKKALELPESAEYKPERAKIFDNLADTYAALGDLQEALLTYREASDLFDGMGDRLGKARALSGTGLTYGRLGNWRSALDLFQQALALQQGPAENRALVTTQMNIGNAHRKLGQAEKALEAHNRALKMAKLPVEKSITYIELGRDYALADNHNAAIDQFDMALASAVGDEAATARALARQARGQLLVEQDIDVQSGLADLQEALNEHRVLHSEAGIAQTLQAIARAEHKLGRVAKAIERAAEALDITEALRIRVGSPKLRQSFTGLQSPSYELHIALLMELANSDGKTAEQAPDYAALALEVSERARARSLVELLTEARTDDKQGIDRELLQSRNEKRQQLAGLTHRLETLAAAGSSEATTVQKSLRSVQADLDIIEARIHKQNRRYAELTQPQHLKAADIQSLLKPAETENSNTIILEYSLGEEQSFLWGVTTNSIESWNLPGREEIEAAARKVYNSLKTVDLDNASRNAAQHASAKLAEMILKPAIGHLKGKRLVIVPDGALQYIPFGALPVPGQDNSSLQLIEQHEVVTLPSASTLTVLRRAEQKREPATRPLAIFADPVFNRQDTRFAGNPHVEHHASTRSAEQLNASRLSRLPASGREADAIANLAAPEPILKATGFTANRSNVLNSPLTDYQRVHFATHGLINTQYPELSSLALSAFDKDGAPLSSFLRLHDIYSLKLNADLVVLSACEAALGKDIRGEGLIGLTRGFMYAGTSRVVASLWRASDTATAALMEEFYRLMLKQNLKPADALRKAQLTISGKRKWRDPYYWAGFILQGDWR
ncbi:MAG: CHAT domain-containing protein [Pseudomonadales bacterium]